MNELSRCRLICLVSALGAAAGMALSWRLWVAPVRDFPTLPLTSWFDFAPEVTTGLMPVLLFGIMLGWRRHWGWAGLAAWLLFTGADLTRGQPWLYQYVLLACVAGGRPWACRLIMAGIFFWAGVSKLNPFFFNLTGPWMTGHLPGLKGIYLLLPFVEIAVGLLLPFTHWITRWLARGVVLCISIGALVCLIPMFWNTVVWPWQIANVALVWLATARAAVPPQQPSQPPVVSLPARWRGLVAAFLAVVMPALIFTHLWPEYFSWRVYDGRPKLSSSQLRASDELNVPLPPDPWLLRRTRTP